MVRPVIAATNRLIILEISNLIAVMKNIIKSLMLFAVAAMAFTSCATEVVEVVVKPNDSYTLNFTAGTPDSRTSVEVDGTAAKFSWAEDGETFTFVQNSTDGLKKGTNVSFVNNGGLAEITATFKYATSPIVAIYPEKAWVGTNNTKFNEAKLIVPSDQNILDSTFDPNADLLVSNVVIPENVTDTYNVQFARLVAVGKMTLKNLPVDGTEIIKKVKFSIDSENALTGRLYIDLENTDVSEWGYSGQAFNYVNLIGGDVVATTANDIYFTCMPATVAAGESFTVEVTTDVATYTHSVTIPDGKSIEFKPGRVAEFGVNMENVERVEIVGLPLPWSESFDSDDLSLYDITNGGGTTKVYTGENLAGGAVAGEILIAKGGGSMTATFASDGEAKTLNLWFKSNKDFIEVSSATENVTITKLTAYAYTVALAEGVSNFKLTLTNNKSGDNARVDDIVLTDETPELEEIVIADATTTFKVNDEFIFDGTVTAIYQNGVSEDVTEYATVDRSDVNMTVEGTYTVTITYNSVSATYKITVTDATADDVVEETKTINFTGGSGTNADSWSFETDPVTCLVTTNGNATKPRLDASLLRMYATGGNSNLMTITTNSTTKKKISKVVVYCSAASYAEALSKGEATVDSDASASISLSGNNVIYTITGDTEQLAITTSAQARMSKIDVTYAN